MELVAFIYLAVGVATAVALYIRDRLEWADVGRPLRLLHEWPVYAGAVIVWPLAWYSVFAFRRKRR